MRPDEERRIDVDLGELRRVFNLLQRRVTALEKNAHVPYDFTELERRLELLEAAAVKVD